MTTVCWGELKCFWHSFGSQTMTLVSVSSKRKLSNFFTYLVLFSLVIWSFWDFHNWYSSEMVIILAIVNDRKPLFLLMLITRLTSQLWPYALLTDLFYEHRHNIVKLSHVTGSSTTDTVKKFWSYQLKWKVEKPLPPDKNIPLTTVGLASVELL